MTSFRRPLLIYCVTVVGPTLVVLTLGLTAVRRQYQASETSRKTTRGLQESRLAGEIERRMRAGAEAVLMSDAWARLVVRLASDDPAVVDQARLETEAIRRAHPVAGELFVTHAGALVYPRVQPSFPRDPAEWIREEPTAIRVRLHALLVDAEQFENAGRLSAALAAYRQAHALSTTRRIQALATAGMARSSAAAGDVISAAQAWARLATEFADLYDRNDRPHAVVAAAELAGMSPDRGPLIAEVRKALIAGRWSITPDQAGYFLDRMPAQDRRLEDGPFLRTLAFARRLRRTLPHMPRVSDGGQSEAGAIIADGVRDQLFYRAHAGTAIVAGLSPDPAWVTGTLIPSVRSETLPGVIAQFEEPALQRSPFVAGVILPRISVVQQESVARTRDVLTFVAGIVAVLGVLGMGVVLLARDVARETHLNRLRADLVSGVSHELKSPLSVIRVYAETIDNTADLTPEERRQFTSAIVEETERLRRLVDDVVDFSKIQQGERPYHLVSAPIADVVRRAAERFEPYARVRGLSLNASVPEVVETVDLDPRAVEQAVLNLLDNAAKYAGDSTEIDLRLRTSGAQVLVEVRDRGIGIPAAEQANIFNRFHRGDHADRGGYGLGLYLVRHIMEAHGGRVEVTSARGEGSVFTLHFPHRAPEVADAQSLAG